jgi:hypothetical protein
LRLRRDYIACRLADALAPFAPYPRDAPPNLPFQWDATTLQYGLNFTLSTDAGPIDLLGEVVGGGVYDALHKGIPQKWAAPGSGRSRRCGCRARAWEG